MRLILILIVIVAIFAVVQSKRHNCEFGDDGWFDCVVGKTADEFSSKTPETSPATPAAEAPATETPAPETPQ
ncbi:hypothetical protein AUC71_02520 [Methyloceanibacter marginalis]|jgi:hypothetical protein|uniref:Uncharacterized protein n=1 Tax=Methyloceanibacter marginalis TaxID=1774971 RepID=A0A1E3W8C2_9HYPH|nr:hypothetical protein [Methyloceanibacter marginalis]ODS02068.1 hypothetical protein AUC71_02520 [Methyloceanibacter marginalis]